MTSKRRRFAATVWWAACTLWAYVAWGELAIATELPEFLCVIAVLGTFLLAGKRIAKSEARPALVRSALVAVGLSVAVVFLAPLLLLNLGADHDQVTLFLLGSNSVTCLLAWPATRPPAPEPDMPQRSSKFVVLGWLIALGITGVAAFLVGWSG